MVRPFEPPVNLRRRRTRRRVDPAKAVLTARLQLLLRVIRLMNTCDRIAAEARQAYRDGYLTEAEMKALDGGCDSAWMQIVDARPRVPFN